MCLTYLLSLYPFAVPKPDFLYKTATLRLGVRHQFSRRKQILVDYWVGEYDMLSTNVMSSDSVINVGSLYEPRQANLCLREFRHDKF